MQNTYNTKLEMLSHVDEIQLIPQEKKWEVVCKGVLTDFSYKSWLHILICTLFIKLSNTRTKEQIGGHALNYLMHAWYRILSDDEKRCMIEIVTCILAECSFVSTELK